MLTDITLVRRQLMAAACKAAGGLPGCYEMTVGHPDKGQLELAVVRRRLQPFLDDGTPIIVTQASCLRSQHDHHPQHVQFCL